MVVTPAPTDIALIVQQPGRPQHVLVRYLALLLNYRYGLDIMVVHRLMEGLGAVQQHGSRIACAFVVRSRSIESASSVVSLSSAGAFPLFLVLPSRLIGEHRQLCHRMAHVHHCAWENAFNHSTASLHQTVSRVFAELGIGELLVAPAPQTQHDAAQLLRQRVARVPALPTVPEVALRILRLVEDPDTTTEELELILLRDPAVVHKLLQVVRATEFAGTTGRLDWSLQEAIVRVGRRRVGAIALQIKLMNSLLRPQESGLDLQRFWRHSVACAMVADRLCTGRILALPQPPDFTSYWIASLLHDIGKLVLGFFFWDHFRRVLREMEQAGLSFRAAEAALGDQAHHEFLGRLLLERSRLDPPLLEAVGRHHSPAPDGQPLAWIVHLANNLAHEMGLGYPAQTPVVYSAPVLQALQLDEAGARALAAGMATDIRVQVEQVVRLCLGGDGAAGQ